MKYTVGSLAVLGLMASVAGGSANSADFGPSNPFYAASTLPFGAPPFDKIKDGDYQPAIEAGMAQQLAEIDKIAEQPRGPDFREHAGCHGAQRPPAGASLGGLQRRKSGEHESGAAESQDGVGAADCGAQDAIRLNKKLFERIAAIYAKRASLKLDAESLRLVERQYDEFVHSGANLSDKDKEQLKAFNKELSSLSDAFSKKLLAATKAGAYATQDKSALAGLSDAQLAAAAQAAKGRAADGYLIPLQNTTQQPVFASLSVRATREAIFSNSWNRAERGDANDTRDIIAHIAQLRAQRARLLGFASHAAWKLEDQMAKTPEAALQFMDALVPVATAKAASEAQGHSRCHRRAEGGLYLAGVGLGFLRRSGPQGKIRS